MEITDMMPLRKITPSNISPWEGTPVEGSRYTAEQLRMMKAERPDWTRFTDRPVTLRGEPTSRWEPPVTIVAPCPIIAWTKNRTRVLIITPAGFKQWADATRDFIDRRS
jgi:hypothetical protein